MRLFCIAGMHRSGTSLASRVMNLLGVELGPDSELTGARPDNPRGYWENDRITLFNDRLLAELGGTWSDPPLLSEGWEKDPALGPFRLRARVLIEERFAGSELAGWKDPRNSLVMPFWQSAVPLTGSLICLRDPRAVAASLRRRDGFDEEISAWLWLCYMSRAERERGHRLIIEYDDFFEARERTLARLVRFLDVPMPDAGRRARIDDFIAIELRHGYPDHPPAGAQMRRALALYERLRRHTRSDSDAAAVARGNRAEPGEIAESCHDRRVFWQRSLATQLDRIRTLMDERDDLVRQRDTVISQTADLTSHRDDLIRQRDTAIAQRDAIASHRDDLIGQRDVALAQVAEIASHRNDLIGQRDVALEQRDALMAHRDDLIHQRDVAFLAVSQVEAHRDEVIVERDVALAQRNALALHRDDLIRQRDVALEQRDELIHHRDDLIRQRDVAMEQRDELLSRQAAEDNPSRTRSYPPEPDNDPAASA